MKRISPKGRLIAFDVDIDAINAASERLKDDRDVVLAAVRYNGISEYSYAIRYKDKCQQNQ